MKKVFLGLALLFISTIIISAQNPTSTPIEDDGVVKISTTLIQVDVSVTDKNGKQIIDLKPEDFEILENGDRQEITNFFRASRTLPILSRLIPISSTTKTIVRRTWSARKFVGTGGIFTCLELTANCS